MDKVKNGVINDKQNADIIYSTLHKSKGMEYDIVHLKSDFITEQTVINHKDNIARKVRTLEDINILYVAATRAKNCLKIAPNIFPSDYKHLPNSCISTWE